MSQKTIVLHSPFDAHAHFREGVMAKNVVPYTSQVFAGALAMPNTRDFGERGIIATSSEASRYRDFIEGCVPPSIRQRFKLLTTIYLNSKTSTQDVREGFGRGDMQSAKLYPLGATTNSDKGWRHFRISFRCLK